MLKYTTTTLKKLEELFEELNYEVRYEKGSFQSGYCLVEARNIAVVNKFFDTEARVNVLLDILQKLNPHPAQVSEKGQETLRRALKTLKNNAESEIEQVVILEDK
jgi:hypothetical protein